MQTFEYKVVPAPEKPVKAKGVRPGPSRFARTMQDVLNTHGADGWDYLRTDTLPCVERVGLFRRVTTTEQTMLVFRRALPQPDARTEDIARTEPTLSPRTDGLTPDEATRPAIAASVDTSKPIGRAADAPRLFATRSKGNSAQ